MNATALLNKDSFTVEEIVVLLKAREKDAIRLFEYAAQAKENHVQNKVYFRGLIEFSNHCSKNCFYCGIRKSNPHVKRYNLTDEEILEAARFAWSNRYGSLVLQSGELEGEGFTRRIEALLKKIGQLSNGGLRVTLSCGEQSYETYRRWFEKGASRYLLRIESSNPLLYKKLHPDDPSHRFSTRMRCLDDLKRPDTR